MLKVDQDVGLLAAVVAANRVAVRRSAIRVVFVSIRPPRLFRSEELQLDQAAQVEASKGLLVVCSNLNLDGASDESASLKDIFLEEYLDLGLPPLCARLVSHKI